MIANRNAEREYKYKQIYQQIKNQILSGIYKPQEKLPSKRQLAEQSGVSTNSVIVALDQLLAEGYIYSVERKGYFVEDITLYVADEKEVKPLPKHLKETRILSSDIISFSHMSANMDLFPSKEWLKCEQKALKTFHHELSFMSHNQGPIEVRQTLAQYISFNRGVRCEPEQIIFHSSSQALVSQLLELCGDNKSIALENPGYARYYELIQRKGWKVHTVPLDESGFQIEAIQHKDIGLLYTTPSHQFPTGIIMPVSRRFELLNWANGKEGRYIIEDDYDSEFKYGTSNIPSLQSLDRNNRTIYTGTFSKTLFPGIRISYMVLPPELLEVYREKFDYLLPQCNTLNLYTLLYFIKDGYYQKHLRKMTHHFEAMRQKLIKELKRTFQNDINILDVPAGLHFLVKIKTTRDYEEITARAEKARIHFFNIKRFSLSEIQEPADEHSFIIGFASLKEEEMKEAVQRLFTTIKGS
ncbi:PLP-dependent aminotransferase family protein [Rummeliibacillus pycnus]|uniref:MocR-like transcriptional regulator GabR n=1 Tax=Rummeliibacillus pycnus TaxID=101070 RepID=UPI0037C9079B